MKKSQPSTNYPWQSGAGLFNAFSFLKINTNAKGRERMSSRICQSILNVSKKVNLHNRYSREIA